MKKKVESLVKGLAGLATLGAVISIITSSRKKAEADPSDSRGQGLEPHQASSLQKVEAEKHEAEAGGEEVPPEDKEHPAAVVAPARSIEKMETEPHEELAQENSEKPDDNESTPPTPVIRPTKEAEAPEYGTTSRKHKAKLRDRWRREKDIERRWFDHDNLMIFFTGALVVATSIYAFTSYRQMNIMQDSLNVVERPYIWPKTVTLNNIAEGQTPTAEVLFENSGRTPAINATFNVYINLTESFIPDNPDKYPNFADISGKALIPPGAVYKVRASAANIGLKLGGDELQRVTEHKLYLSVYGKGYYDDKFGKHWKFKFCSFYDSGHPSEPQPCPNHNDYE